MAHAQASLVGIILSSQIMTVPRFQNVPQTMIRSFKLKQLHFDVTGIVLQSSDHTFCCLAIKSFERFKTFEWHWIQTNCQQLCMKTVDVCLKGGYINSPTVGSSHRCYFMSIEDRLLKGVIPYFAALRPCSILLRI